MISSQSSSQPSCFVPSKRRYISKSCPSTTFLVHHDDIEETKEEEEEEDDDDDDEKEFDSGDSLLRQNLACVRDDPFNSGALLPRHRIGFPKNPIPPSHISPSRISPNEDFNPPTKSPCPILSLPISPNDHRLSPQIIKKFPGMLEGDIQPMSEDSDVFVYDPFNPLNVEITKANVEEILRKFGVKLSINNFTLYRRSFIHRSYIKYPEAENEQNNVIIVPKPINCLPLSTKSNERLEFLGDGVLECVTKFYLYRRFPKENEGFMTEKKIALVKNEAIGKIALEMGLHKWFVMSKHAEMKGIRHNLKKLGCLFEAFIGAIFLDFNSMEIQEDKKGMDQINICGPGFQMAKIFIENVFETLVDWSELIRTDDNFKNILQVKIQKEFKVTQDYLELSPYHVTTGFHMGVFLCLGQSIYHVQQSEAISIKQFQSLEEIHTYIAANDGKVLIFLGEGRHKIKKKAEQVACDASIRELINIGYF